MRNASLARRRSAPITAPVAMSADDDADLFSAAGVAPSGALGIILDAKAVILADVSSSMQATCEGGSTRVALMRDALGRIHGGTIVPFADEALDACKAEHIPSPSSLWGTNFGAAFNGIRDRIPSRVLLISDGETEDVDEAIEAAKRLRCPVDTMFVGDPDAIYDGARETLREIARVTGGSYAESTFTSAPALAAAVSRLLLKA